MASSTDFPKPKYVTGGCLCQSLTYRIDFPDNFDFEKGSLTCQCTQCRKNTGSFFFPSQNVPESAFRWTSSGTDTLGRYNATPDGERGFCTKCGSFLYWRHADTSVSDRIGVAVGTVDPLFLFGEGADGTQVPKGGFGHILSNGGGGHLWCDNEIPGVTDKMEFLQSGRRWPKSDE
ncbi:Mss4-like protein [Xylaria flabelliformis]|nr:Mss4-like protein [Xylaria flabelliformis]